MLLSETKAKGMTTSLLKHNENDSFMLSCHLYGPNTFSQRVNSNLSSFINFLLCRLDINMFLVLSIFIIITFTGHFIFE